MTPKEIKKLNEFINELKIEIKLKEKISENCLWNTRRIYEAQIESNKKFIDVIEKIITNSESCLIIHNIL